ncbi:Ig-like domain-containing protein [Chitinophaga filiformis]|uniref:Gliding motility-associated C-terminal domain-containing protein n=1 Tax=Chitinophaga filiformis TaxID=104663 RepID=A0A1G7WLJ5_CHIFI|nr:gliding motility-associated C-terminal domain-containing protein [Chitinophaga filiformis]SDG72813.1 gliding motility-associated C-terminal domain-containing protein [Chitinophaga filiformis]
MKRHFTYSFYRGLCLMAILLMGIMSTQAQTTDIKIGSSTAGNEISWYPCPLQDYKQGARAQYLYLASELHAAGMGAGDISALAFNVLNLRGVGKVEGYVIKIGFTSVNNLDETRWETVNTQVYGPVHYQPVAGYNKFAFSSTVTWNGIDNIIVEVCNGDPGGATSDENPEVAYTELLPFRASHTYRANTGNECGSTTTTNTGDMSNRPDIMFSWTAAPACTGTPVAGTPIVNTTDICATGKVDLSLTGTTLASGLTFQWQSSPNNTTWTNIPGASLPTYTASQTVTTWYRCVVTCTSGGASTSTSVQAVTPSPVSGTFFINNATATGGNNFNSFKDAVDFIKCGINGAVIFNVVNNATAYNEQVMIPPIAGASATNTITFNGNGALLHYLSGDAKKQYVLELNGADFVTVNNLQIKADGTGWDHYGIAVHLTNDADNNTISNCIITTDTQSTDFNYAGIAVTGGPSINEDDARSDNNTFSGNTITGGIYGILMMGSSSQAVMNNKVLHNKIYDFHNTGVKLQGTFSAMVDGNEISCPARTTAWSFVGIELSSLNTKAIINANRISNPYGGVPGKTDPATGINVNMVVALTTLENKITNNLIYNLNTGGHLIGINCYYSNNVWFYHNTIILDGTTAPGTYDTRGFATDNGAGGQIFKNNLVYISRTGTSKKYAIYSDGAGAGLEADRNNYYIEAAATNAFIGYEGQDAASLTQWQALSSRDQASVFAPPLFVNAATGNYTPQNNVVDNRGSYENVDVDIAGAARSHTTPDIGAFEFTPPVCTVPPTPGTATLSKPVVCVNTSVILGASGNSVGVGQTYRWQTAIAPAGPFTAIGNVLDGPDTVITATASLWYRLAVTCSGNTAYTVPVYLTVNPAMAANTYTINKGAPASATNFTSFTAAADALSCGITGPVVFNVVANSGPYNEQLILDTIKGASAVNTVTFNGNGNTIAFSSMSSMERAVIKLRHADHVIIDSLTIDANGTGDYGYGVHLLNDADSNIIRRCNILVSTTEYSGRAAVVINGNDESDRYNTSYCDANLIEKNNIEGGYAAVTLYGGSDYPAKNNRILNNKITDFTQYGVSIGNTLNTTIAGNTISRPTRNASMSDYYGILSEGHSGLLVEGNRLVNPYGGNPSAYGGFRGMDIEQTQQGAWNEIRNNVIHATGGSGNEVVGIYSAFTDKTNYYHNTIEIESSPEAGVTGFALYGNADSLAFTNNIVSLRSESGRNERIGLNLANAGQQILSISHNNIYLKATTAAYVAKVDQTTFTDIAGWQASPFGIASIGVAPVYADAANGNFAPIISPFDNAGAPVGVAKDILGVSRSATKPDLGAYEINIPACTAPPTPGTAVANPTGGICLGDTVKLDLSGNTTGGTQTYRWQQAKSAAGPWTSIGEWQYLSSFATPITFENYFRCILVCGTDTVYSAPVQVNMNAAFPAGEYTINPALPAGVTNFQSFNKAVEALECGITGPVVFKVAAGTYNEEVRMHTVAGAGPDSRITFRSDNNDAASVILTNVSTSSDNYILSLDSAMYVTFRSITMKAGDNDYGKVVLLAGTASYDSILNCKIIAPDVINSSTDVAAIIGENFLGKHIVIKGNTIENGSAGVYLFGVNDQNLSQDHVIDSNIISNSFKWGVYSQYTSRINITRNTINLDGDMSSSGYGIYQFESDTAWHINYNTINILNTVAGDKIFGIQARWSSTLAAAPLQIEGNKIIGLTNNKASLYGLYTEHNNYTSILNNVVSVQTTAKLAYGLWVSSDENATYYNNTIYNGSADLSAKTNSAAKLNEDGASNVVVRNNIFYHGAAGIALEISNEKEENTDYNVLYSTGAVLASTSLYKEATLPAWSARTGQDLHSIYYKPALTLTDGSPVVNSPDVWAIHGRGVQIPGNDHDINGKARPVTLQAGVPDLGAYEFEPTSVPALLTAVPAAPAAGTTQHFMMGSDSVMSITWAAGAPVPASMNIRRYTGVLPPNVPASAEQMYFYNDVETTGSGAYDFSVKTFYMDPWQGFVKAQYQLGLGRTDANDKWLVGDSSKVNEFDNYITESKLSFLDKFTGLVDSARAVVPVVIPPADSSNRGTRFWVGYGHHEFFSGSNDQDMLLYLSAEEAADVTVKVNGTSWIRRYHVAANTTLSTDLIPKNGLEDARLMTEGISDRGISIESDKPIVAYAHIYGHQSSGATMLLPVGTYGYEYYSLGYNQVYGMDDYSWAYVVADQPNTVVEITPSVPTVTGHPANVPFTVTLNKGEVYQVLGARIDNAKGYDVTGTRFRSIQNAQGKCYPIAVFSGNSRTSVSCDPSGSGGNGDNFIQQCFPSQAWGKRYLTAPTSTDEDPKVLMGNVYRIMVKDPATKVKVDGSLLAGLNNGRFYQFVTDAPAYIEADQPIMVAQYMASWDRCTNTGGYGDPEMIYLSPLEQGIKKLGFYRNTEEGIVTNYLTLIIPTGGMTSLKIDNGTLFDYTYDHPSLPGYTVVVKRWDATKDQSYVVSDSAFTAITYGLGEDESYGYNAGTLVRNLNTRTSISNVHSGTNAVSDYTCENTPFRFTFISTQRPASLQWNISKVSNISPAADVIQDNPVPVDSFIANNKKYYRFAIDQDYSFSKAGTYYVPVVMQDPSFESCDNTVETFLPVTVIAAPKVDYTTAFNGCVSDSVHFTGNAITANGAAIGKWKWDFGNSAIDSVQNPVYLFTAGGTYPVSLTVIGEDGCIADTAKDLVVKGPAVGILLTDSFTVCTGSNVTFEVQSPATGVDYNWYDAATGGKLVASGSTLNLTNVTADAQYYLETIKDGCTSPERTPAEVVVLPALTAPVVKLDSTGVNVLRFTWGTVPNATGYEVSTDGLNWTAPSTGSQGLSHTISGLQPMQEVKLYVRALGCEPVAAEPVSGTTLLDGIYIPNAFTPNGDAVNDVLKVYGSIIKDIHLMIFNQWGEKLFDSDSQDRGWDGTHKGKQQPSGVYMYVCRLVLLDGTTVDKKGIINLIR